MANFNQLVTKDASNTSSNLTTDMNDIRITTGTAAPTGGYTGDIYIRAGHTSIQTSNGWSYVTRPDGITECWKTFTVTGKTGSWWQAVYQVSSGIAKADRTYPVVFSETPVVEYGWEPTNGANHWVYCSGQTAEEAKTFFPNPYIARCTSASVDSRIWVHAMGVV